MSSEFFHIKLVENISGAIFKHLRKTNLEEDFSLKPIYFTSCDALLHELSIFERKNKQQRLN